MRGSFPTYQAGTMGCNADIKSFQAKHEGQPLTLFEPRYARAPIIHKLLASSWIQRGSDIVARGATLLTHCVRESLVMYEDEMTGKPRSFKRTSSQRRYVVQDIIEAWVIDRRWWSETEHISRRFYRILCVQGVFDIAYDGVLDEWLLIGIQD